MMTELDAQKSETSGTRDPSPESRVPKHQAARLNALTVDVEDYFHVQAFAGTVARSSWDRYPLRVADNTRRTLDLLDRHHVKGTFFVLGWVAEKVPTLVKEIFRRGHEIACHGYGHELVFDIGPERFRQDVRRAKAILEDQAGTSVAGYRAPTYSITARSLWALDILVEEGFAYDSSIFPIVHDTYGIPDASRFPHDIATKSGSIREFPLTTFPLTLFRKQVRLPIAGGGYLRLFPASLIAAGIRRVNSSERQPAVLYFHPWEIDPAQPRIAGRITSRLRHYVNLDRTEAKLATVLRGLQFGKMADVLARHPVPCAAGSGA